MKNIKQSFNSPESEVIKGNKAHEYDLGITKRLLDKYKPSKEFITLDESHLNKISKGA